MSMASNDEIGELRTEVNKLSKLVQKIHDVFIGTIDNPTGLLVTCKMRGVRLDEIESRMEKIDKRLRIIENYKLRMLAWISCLLFVGGIAWELLNKFVLK